MLTVGICLLGFLLILSQSKFILRHLKNALIGESDSYGKENLLLNKNNIERIINGEVDLSYDSERGAFVYKTGDFVVRIKAFGNLTNVFILDYSLETKYIYLLDYQSDSGRKLNEFKYNDFYKKKGFYKDDSELSRLFGKIKNFDWANMRKQGVFSLSDLSSLKKEKESFDLSKYEGLECFEGELQKIKDSYKYILIHENVLSIDERHFLEKNYYNVEKLMTSYMKLNDEDKVKEKEKTFDSLESVIKKYDLIKAKIYKQSVNDFEKITEIMKN